MKGFSYNVYFEQDDSDKKHKDSKIDLFCLLSTTQPSSQEKKAVTWIGVPERIIL